MIFSIYKNSPPLSLRGGDFVFSQSYSATEVEPPTLAVVLLVVSAALELLLLPQAVTQAAIIAAAAIIAMIFFIMLHSLIHICLRGH